MTGSKKETMTSRERLWATVKGRPVDRVPVFLWLNAHTGCRLMAESQPSRHGAWNLLARLFWRRFLAGGGSEANQLWRMLPLLFDVHSFNWANAYSLELGSDLMQIAHAAPWHYFKYGLEDRQVRFTDMFGVTRGLGHGIYPDMIRPAIQEFNDLTGYRLPEAKDNRLYSWIRRTRQANPGASIGLECWGAQDFTSTSVIGMERFMIFLYDYPEEMKIFMRRWTDYQIEVIRRSVAAGADVVMIEDDYGYDRRPLISLPMWKEFTYPELKRLVTAAHECGALALLHSCGYQMPFLPFYVEAGLDVLHALQPKAGNNFQEAYNQFGDRLTFATGIDIQLGEFMTPVELRESILENYRIGGRNGRHVLATTHEIQYTMPETNLRVILNTVKEIQAGLHDR